MAVPHRAMNHGNDWLRKESVNWEVCGKLRNCPSVGREVPGWEREREREQERERDWSLEFWIQNSEFRMGCARVRDWSGNPFLSEARKRLKRKARPAYAGNAKKKIGRLEIGVPIAIGRRLDFGGPMAIGREIESPIFPNSLIPSVPAAPLWGSPLCSMFFSSLFLKKKSWHGQDFFLLRISNSELWIPAGLCDFNALHEFGLRFLPFGKGERQDAVGVLRWNVVGVNHFAQFKTTLETVLSPLTASEFCALFRLLFFLLSRNHKGVFFKRNIKILFVLY